MERRLESLYSEMIEFINKSQCQTDLTTCMAIRGRQYNGDLMVIGRAVNGWEPGIWPKHELSDPAKFKKYIAQLYVVSNPVTGYCPLDWVKKAWGNNSENKYNTKKSAFWRIVARVFNILDSEKDWTSKLIWSNLYKIAPAESGNPSNKLIKLQQDYCIDILREEINLYKPKCLLFLTGLDWAAPFLEGINEINVRRTQKDLVVAAGSVLIDGYIGRVLIARHPQGKNESKMVEQIRELMLKS
ncbi:hypothetical protein E4665_11600 [Sporolactobacillus shoreae]|uniref:Uracil-DNA glycosylase-like domain-containing protein n=1 Tax=Sporolactobacillus shoreae TaxID=1465501 RepID=A0A4Z0GKL5_9BACL|nr:hypothetical protein [Sporolactobacillus shoreae]TGA97487.1 hypothetical protein E4665_11600 [Sporolactobacillus shoreae]